MSSPNPNDFELTPLDLAYHPGQRIDPENLDLTPMNLTYHPGQHIDPNNLDLTPLGLDPTQQTDPNELDLTPLDSITQTAPRNLNLSPWVHGCDRCIEPADEDALWLTIELQEPMQDLDDMDLLMVVAMEISESRAFVTTRAQHYIRPRCLSIPCRMSPTYSYEVSRGEALRLVKWWFDEIKAGRAHLDRAVLFGPR
ncbi:hypothetical protein N7535_001481 [Penicillium sp. DV-2018c]|nr:hypothetical protein N7461_005274 [Penicillium sp. DV-2018c]KAJ5582861.1 hypothetical protein N7535_001481 [Penicillium sp. DV-2018c]